jgi:hypothetical protein
MNIEKLKCFASLKFSGSFLALNARKEHTRERKAT